MANKEHVELLRQGVRRWNEWRGEHPGEVPDLSEALLRYTDLRYTNLSKADLRYTYLSKADLREANLHEANLRWAYLDEADLSRADLRGALLSKAYLSKALLSKADLSGANLSGADLSKAYLSKANLSGADLSGADLSRADLSRADLRGALLSKALLSKADLSEANLSETIFANTNLTDVRGLDDCQHHAPSPVDFRTLSYGPLPLTFLRGCGLPDTLIDYLPSLLNTPLQLYSCFISYSSLDEEFAQRLYADLQNKGVRCWFAPEDMKIGDEFRSRIDQAIHVHDRLLLILSGHSVNSRWVQKEVETAFEKEERDKRLVLFPVRVDNAVMDSTVGWAADVRRQRHIGNFTQWKEHDAYQKAFTRLLRDLKPEPEQGTKR